MADWWRGKDEWFDRYWSDKVTEEFAAWWVGHYGVPHDFSSSLDDQHEYWVRMGFALQGWLARKGELKP